MKRITSAVIAVIMIMLVFTGCQKQSKIQYTKYSDTFFDAFDTVTMVVGYTKTEDEFKGYFEKIKERFNELHKYYDIYNDYEGINNIKTINDNAGIKPVKVNKEIIDLIQFAMDWDKKTNGATNIAMGSVLRIWHDYREEGKIDPDNAKLPPMDALKEANKHTDIDKIIVDVQNSTVYLEDKAMSLDVGAVAKGYATELVAKEIMNSGFKSGIISAGGNVRVLGKPVDGVRERWGIGIQDPRKSVLADDDNLLDTIFLNDQSVVSSGDYERFYTVGGKNYHHLIDPQTLMPGEHYSAVTIVTPDSGDADALSTAVFLLPYEQSKALVKSLKNVEVIWVFKDGKVEATDGMKKIMKSEGATGAKAQ
ncbi:FAD:protein FMN transferase [Clostridium swellfunianum]|uniref:FAD:protein FMN transferase n=1 Tax=Clostridium swellfunianum TaxID=1367462 RepID=UPI00202F9C61|nr:FAD:protein FMN transferase [Clostridium swellfunianum]MCM0648556.1 FAD:protein FMN transferase [Clostridium swellfunianum]